MTALRASSRWWRSRAEIVPWSRLTKDGHLEFYDPRRRLRIAIAVVVALAIVGAILALAACASPAPKPAVNAADAARYSAELTAAQVDHRETLEAAEAARLAGTLAGAELEKVRTAGKALDSAMLRFKAEFDLYRAGGGESDAFNRARAAMAQARTNLALTYEAATREH